MGGYTVIISTTNTHNEPVLIQIFNESSCGMYDVICSWQWLWYIGGDVSLDGSVLSEIGVGGQQRRKQQL